MKRRIIHIEESRCNGCGLCAAACHEGAIEMVNGKARLTREDYCDGLGDCLPACPTGAITFEEREAPAYDHAAVLAAKAARAADTPLPCGCPGSQSRAIRRPEAAPTAGDIPSELRQWPVQIKLAPVNAPYFDGCDLLIAADCTAYAYGAFHRDFIRGRVTLSAAPSWTKGTIVKSSPPFWLKTTSAASPLYGWRSPAVGAFSGPPSGPCPPAVNRSPSIRSLWAPTARCSARLDTHFTIVSSVFPAKLV